MSLEQQIVDLTTATTNLLDAVNVRKSALDERVETAGDFANAAQMSANAAAASVTDANQAAGEAAGSAAQALAIYGTAAAQQSAVIAAQTAASLAEGYAAAASSVAQQDLSGVTAAALHRSPNAVTALFVYDTSKDSDGGAWTEKCQHTSWYNEEINGKWLGAQASEAAARAVSGATAGDYFQRSSDGRFYKLNDTSGITEVFRGNKRDFPRLAGIVAEAANVTIYDLTEPGRPMWMHFLRAESATARHALGGGGDHRSVCAINGMMAVADGSAFSSMGLGVIDFPKDRDSVYSPATVWSAQRNHPLAARNTLTDRSGQALPVISSAQVNAVAMTVLPDAPVDPVTGLKVPTIAVATEGGVSVIRHNGSASNLFTVPSRNISFDARNAAVFDVGENGRNYRKSYPPYTAFTAFVGGPLALNGSVVTLGHASVNRHTGKSFSLARPYLANSVAVIRDNDKAKTLGAVAIVARTHNTGHQFGDIRRAYLADTGAEGLSAPASVADRSYKAASAAVNGALTKSQVASNAELVAYSGFSAANYLREPYSADLDLGTGEWSVGAWVKPIGRYNLLTATEDCTNPAWSFKDATGQNVTGPDGQPAILAEKINVYTNAYIRQTVGSAVAGTTYTVLVSLYAGTTDTASIGIGAVSDGAGPWGGTGNTTCTKISGAGTISPASGLWVISNLSPNEPTVVRITRKYISSVQMGFNVYPGGHNSETAGHSVLLQGVDFRLYENAGKLPTYQRVNTATDYDGSSGAFIDRAGATGPAIRLGLEGGLLTATAFDGTTTRTATAAPSYTTADQWEKVEANYTTDGKLSIKVNGVEVASATGTPLLSLNNPDAVLTIGNSYALDAPFPGSIALLKLSATVPTPEQSVWMYEQEKQMFREGAQCCLPDSGTIVDLAYDDATDKWIAASATNISEWSGLVRTNVTPVPAGSYSALAAASGVQLLARSTTNPGVDITIPAYGLREELVKRAESAAQRSKEIVTFDFDAAGGQAEFALPVGYTTKAVYVDGAAKRRGSTKDFTLLFDGFKETVAFAVAPAPAAWVQIHAIKE